MEKDSRGSFEFKSSSKVDDDETASKKKKPERSQASAEDKKKAVEALQPLWERAANAVVSNAKESKPDDLKQKEKGPSEAGSEEETIDTDSSLEQLSQTEEREAARAYLRARLQEINSELSTLAENDPEREAAIAAEGFIESTKHKLDGEQEAQDDIISLADTAYQETLQSLALDAGGVEPKSEVPPGEAEPAPPSDNPAPTEASPESPRYDEPRPFDGSGGGLPPQETARGFSPGFDGASLPPDWRRSYPSRGGTERVVIEPDLAAERQAAVRGLLVGGIVGYLIGRRRGRIKTEKRLLPIQKKLEQEVRTLFGHIADKETEIRKLVRRQTEAVVSGGSTLAPTLETQSVSLGRERSSELTRNHADSLAPARPKAETDPTIKRPELMAQPETLTREQLLELSEKITIGATTLRKVYENSLISEQGLRRAVGEHRRGKDVRRILAEELLIKELSYERDPQLRAQRLKLAAQTAASDEGPLPQIVPEQDAPRNELNQPSPWPQAPSPLGANRRTTTSALIVANFVALVVLIILVVILFVTRL